MKKTLILSLLMALAPWASAATPDFTTTNSVTGTVSKAWFNGFTLNLNPGLENSRLTTGTTSDSALGISDYQEVALNSIAVNVRGVKDENRDCPPKTIRLALTDAAGTVIAVSTSTLEIGSYRQYENAGGVEATFSFAGADEVEKVTVSTTEALYFVYVEDGTTLDIGHVLTGNQMVTLGAQTLIQYSNTNMASSYDTLTYLGTNTACNMTKGQTSYAPRVNISTSALYDIWTSQDGMWNVTEGDDLLFDGRGNSTVFLSEEGATVGWVRVSAREGGDAPEHTLTGGALNAETLGVENGHLTIGNHTVVSGETSVDPGAKLTILGGGILETDSLQAGSVVGMEEMPAPAVELAGELILTGAGGEGADISRVHSLSGVGGNYGDLTIQNAGAVLVSESRVELNSLAGAGTLTASGQDVTLHSTSVGGTNVTAGNLTLGSSGNVLGSVVADSLTLGVGALAGSSPILTADSLISGVEDGAVQLTTDANQVTRELARELKGTTRTVFAGSFVSLTLSPELVDAFARYNVAVTGEELGDSYVLNFVYSSPYTGLMEMGGNVASGAVLMEEVLQALEKGTVSEETLPDTMAAMGALDEALASGDQIGAGKIAAAVAGASVATLGAAYTADVERQLRAIRNRTTTMGLVPGEVHEDLPYYNAWLNAEGDYRKLDQDGSLSGYKLSSWGGTVGFDADVAPSTVLGLALTAMYGDLEAVSADKAKGDLDRYYLSAFARVTNRAWVHTFVVTGSKADITLDRTVSLGNGYDYRTDGTTEGYAVGFLYELAYTISANEESTVCFQPLVNVSYRYTSVDGYRESGSDAALDVDKQDSSVLTFGAGIRMQAAVGENVYNRSSLFELRALVKVDAGDREGAADVSLLPGVAARVETAEVSAVGAELGAGLTIPVGSDEGALFFDASAELRSEYAAINGTVGYRINF